MPERCLTAEMVLDLGEPRAEYGVAMILAASNIAVVAVAAAVIVVAVVVWYVLPRGGRRKRTPRPK